MNKSKRALIIAAIVLDFISAASLLAATIFLGIRNVYVVTEYASYDEFLFYYITMIISLCFDILLYLSAATCLLISIRKGGAKFIESRKVYFAGFIINVFASPLSIASILLYIAHFKYIDIQYIQEERKDEEPEVVIQKPTDEELKEKIAKLRKLKEEGVISEEEFNEQIMKLL